MQIRVIPTLLAILVFVFLTVFCSKNNAPADGVTLWGFPRRFYWQRGGMMPIHRNQYFSSVCLILHLGIALLTIVTCNVMFHLLYLRKNYLTTYKTS
jgi:hypothetical protein